MQRSHHTDFGTNVVGRKESEEPLLRAKQSFLNELNEFMFKIRKSRNNTHVPMLGGVW